VLLRACEASSDELAIGSIRHLFIHYQGAGFLAHKVAGGYFVVLELEPASNMAEALQRLKPFLQHLREEIGD